MGPGSGIGFTPWVDWVEEEHSEFSIEPKAADSWFQQQNSLIQHLCVPLKRRIMLSFQTIDLPLRETLETHGGPWRPFWWPSPNGCLMPLDETGPVPRTAAFSLRRFGVFGSFRFGSGVKPVCGGPEVFLAFV